MERSSHVRLENDTDGVTTFEPLQNRVKTWPLHRIRCKHGVKSPADRGSFPPRPPSRRAGACSRRKIGAHLNLPHSTEKSTCAKAPLKLYCNALSLTRLCRELGTEQYSQSEFAPSEARRPSRREPLRESLIKRLKCLQNCGIM